MEINGRVASILELSMGFIPEMTGYDNIFLRGELYGMRRSEVLEVVDSIIEFANIGEFLHNPVKTYSSGMKARLAFAILTIIDADIYIFDEALGTGDIAFNTQSGEYIKNQIMKNKTVIFTSHSVRTMQEVCSRAVWIEGGRVKMDSDPVSVMTAYRRYMLESDEALTSLAAAGVSDAEYTLAMRSAWNDDFEGYHRLIESAAKHGHSIAQVRYGDRLLSSSDFKDQEHALIMYSRSAEQGNLNGRRKYSMLYGGNLDTVLQLRNILGQMAEGGEPFYQYHYAKMLLSTSWCVEDRMDAFRIFNQSAEQGNTDAKYQVAMMYRDGIGVAKSLDQAITLFSELGEGGHYKSQEILAEMYYNGDMVDRDVKKAFYWYRKSAKQGNQNSQYMVAVMYRDGIGTEVDDEMSRKWFRNYANSSLVEQILVSAKTLSASEDGVGTILDADVSSEELFTLAASTCNSYAIRFIGTQHSVMKDIGTSKGFKRMRAAAEKDEMSKLTMAHNYYMGRGVNRDPGKAFGLYSELAKNGNPAALYQLAFFYKDGEVVEQNLDTYRQFIIMSAERGYSKAIATTQRWESRNARRKEKRRKSASGGTEPPAGE